MKIKSRLGKEKYLSETKLKGLRANFERDLLKLCQLLVNDTNPIFIHKLKIETKIVESKEYPYKPFRMYYLTYPLTSSESGTGLVALAVFKDAQNSYGHKTRLETSVPAFKEEIFWNTWLKPIEKELQRNKLIEDILN